MANNSALGGDRKKAFQEMGYTVKPAQAAILVGGIVSNGRETNQAGQQRNQLREKRLEAFLTDVARIQRAPVGFEGKVNLIGTYASPKLTFGAAARNLNPSKLRAGRKKVHMSHQGGICFLNFAFWLLNFPRFHYRKDPFDFFDRVFSSYQFFTNRGFMFHTDILLI